MNLEDEREITRVPNCSVDLQYRLDQALSLLKELEWIEGKHGTLWCEICEHMKEEGHDPICKLGKAIGGSK